MTYTFKLSRRLAVSQSAGMFLLAILAVACSSDLQENSDPNLPAGSDAPADITVTPERVIAEVGQPIQLTARRAPLRNHDHFALPTRSALDVEWSASGGNISTNGEFSAAAAGTYKVVGKGRGGRGGKPDTTTVIVIPAPQDPVAITILPDTAQLPSQGSRTFTAKAVLIDSTQTDVGVTWRATGGTIDAGGVYTAGSVPGRYVAVATSVTGGLQDTAKIEIDSTVTPAPEPTGAVLQAVRVLPDTVTILSGQSQRFVAQGRLSDGTTQEVAAAYTATGGTIDTAGLFTAGPTPGTFQVTATTREGLVDTSRVIVSALQVGTTIYPGQSIQAAVNAFPGGTTFLLKAGMHRLQSVSPKSGDTFVGEAGTILSGAAVIRPVRDGNYWVADGQTQQNTDYNPQFNCQAGHDGCFYPEQLWLGETLYEHVTSISALSPGKWYFDYATDRIYIGDDPGDRPVETSVTPTAFGGAATNVTIRNLIVERYANAAQKGAIAGGRNWIVEGSEIRWNHGTGIVVGAGSTVRNNYIHHQGQLGLKVLGNSMPSLVEANEIAYNNVAYFGPGPFGEAGATKFVGTDGLVVRGNFSHHNHGPGLWTDISNIRTLYENNRVEDNDWRGIFHEISYAAVIRNNIVRRNGFHFPGVVGAFEGAGILISNSPNVEVYGNTVEDNRNGIMAREDDRGSGGFGPYNTTNLSVHNNIVRQTDAGRAAGITDSDPAFDPYSPTANNRWTANTYVVGPDTKWRWTGNLDVTLSQWKTSGQDSGSTVQ
jgi:parallel beta-helix repeat protein